MAEGIYGFYYEPEYTQPLLRATGGQFEQTEISVPNAGVYMGDAVPTELEPALAQKVTELYDSVRPVTVVTDGFEHRFEKGYVQGTGPGATLRSATYQSSLSGNVGNGFEVAAAAVDSPDDSILYVASIGMGLSGALTGKELKYLRKYGTLLYHEDGVAKPLPVVKSLGKLVTDSGVQITSVGSDSAGAVMTMAYGASFCNGEITTAHQNVRTGFTDLRLGQLAKGMIIDDPKLSSEHTKVSRDALRMSKYITDEFMPKHISDEYKVKNFAPKKSPAMLWAYANGLKLGPSNGDPLLADTIAFARTNPGANILFTLGQHDPLAQSPDLQGRLRTILETTAGFSDAAVSAAIIEGANHGIQTHHPQYLRRLANLALLS